MSFGRDAYNERRGRPGPRHDVGEQRQREHYYGEKKLAPQPLGDKCNPLCPFFQCSRGALLILNKPIRGKPVKVAQCRLTGGNCIDGECQYAGCRLNALLPDGRCAKALEKRIRQQSEDEIFKEMMSFEDYDTHQFVRKR